MRIDKENNIIYFDNDEEFYDFCVETYSINRRVRDHRVRKAGWDFSDWYQSNVNEDTKIVILDSNSTILRRGGMVTGRAGITRKINAYRVNPIEPENSELLMEVGEKWIRESQYMHDDEGLKETERSSKMNQVKTVGNMMNKDEFKKCIDGLKNSTMFHMSLGSKELFHSNFLHWLSVIKDNWDYFIGIMHGLAEVEKFWWEEEGIVDFNQKMFHPNNLNIKVLREYHNFDLSIYIHYKEQKTDTEQNNEYNIDNHQDDSIDVAGDMRGWLPVLILENKTKSLPYEEQLKKYTKKAFEEWASIVKEEVKNASDRHISASQNGRNSITFILLSLLQPNLSNYFFENIKESKNPRYTLKLQSEWKHKTYNDLLRLLQDNMSTGNFNNLDKLIVEDYCRFIESLYTLANTDDWKVYETDCYYDKIIANRKEETNLRIADLREKIIHERMLKILVNKLNDAKLKNEHWDKDKRRECGVVFYQTSFSRGKGITEAFVIINKIYRLMIELQGYHYRRCLILERITNDSKEMRDKRREEIVNELKDGNLWSKNASRWNKDYNPEYSFGDYFKYSYRIIGNETVENVLNEMMTDIKNIMCFYGIYGKIRSSTI